MTENKVLPVGCLFDGNRGFNAQCKLIQELAIGYGWPEDQAVLDIDHDDYFEAAQEAQDYLEDFTPEDHWVGFYEGDFGVYPMEDNDITDEDCQDCYTYHINLDERGEFFADVRNSDDETVYEIKGDQIFEDGFMKDKNDIAGLEKYLIQLSILPDTAILNKG